MTNPSNIIEHKDISEKIIDTRQELMNERKNKKKPLIFKGYTSEADRIKITLKKNKYLYYFKDYDEILKKKKHKTKYNSSDKKQILNTVSQPNMRFKARTDLERIYDTLNNNFCLENDKNILDRQLLSINLINVKKKQKKELIESLKKNKLNDVSINHEELANANKKKEKNLYKISNKMYTEKKSADQKPWARRYDLNKEVTGLLKSYYYKTHFKAAEEIAENDIKKNNKVIRSHTKKNSCFLLPNLIPNFFGIKKYRKKPKKDINQFKFIQSDESSEESDDYNDFEENYNPLVHKKNMTIDPNSMKLLTDMAFSKNYNDVFLAKNENDRLKKEEGKNFSDENCVSISNKIYSKKSQFNKISCEVLGLCNVYSPKSKFNKTSLKAREGKTMITNGLTVKQFEKKYGLEE